MMSAATPSGMASMDTPEIKEIKPVRRVAALIIVLSVMNGFQKEVRDRMLGVISHIEVFAPNGAALADPQKTLTEIRANPNVVGAATFIGAQALLARGEDMKGAMAVSY